MNIKSKIVEEARKLLGTKFVHQGRSSSGCDCLGLLMLVAKNLSLKDSNGIYITDIDERNYPDKPDSSYLYSKLCKHFKEKALDNIKAGDLAFLAFAGDPQHLGIVADLDYAGRAKYSIIHAYSVSGIVCEHRLDHKWRKRIVAAFSLH